MLILTLGILLGCMKPLEVFDAEEVIKKGYPQKSDAYSITFVVGVPNYTVDSEQLRKLNELKKMGLIDYVVQNFRPADKTLQNVEIKITENGKPFIENDESVAGSKKIYLLLEQFDQITNIFQQDKLAKVEYTTNYEPAEPFTPEEVERIAPGCLDEKMKYTVSLIKYDTGWRQIPVF